MFSRVYILSDKLCYCHSGGLLGGENRARKQNMKVWSLNHISLIFFPTRPLFLFYLLVVQFTNCDLYLFLGPYSLSPPASLVSMSRFVCCVPSPVMIWPQLLLMWMFHIFVHSMVEVLEFNLLIGSLWWAKVSSPQGKK